MGKVLYNGELIDAEDGFEEQAAIDQSSGPPVTVPASQPSIAAIAALQVNLVDNSVSGIETAVGLSMAFAIDTGVFLVFFTEPQPDMNYIWNVGASSGVINVVSRDLTSMELRAYDGGVPTNPSEISIQVFRVV